jgi:hypothetical protein
VKILLPAENLSNPDMAILLSKSGRRIHFDNTIVEVLLPDFGKRSVSYQTSIIKVNGLPAKELGE